MPRKFKLVIISALAFTIGMLIYTSHLRGSYDADQRTLQDFYHKTKDALGNSFDLPGGTSRSNAGWHTPAGGSIGDDEEDEEEGPRPGVGNFADAQGKLPPPPPPAAVDMDNDGDVDEEDGRLAREMQNRLKAAEQQAKERANAKAPNRPDMPSEVIGVGSSAGGQPKEAAGAGGIVVGGAPAGGAPVGGVGGAAGAVGAPGVAGGIVAGPAVPPAIQTEEDKAQAELEKLIKKSPVVIFSKTYCPYSKRAKALLLDKYTIEPAPYVVELDTHPLGVALQGRLSEMTGQRTVPNIMVSGKSIGGSDDIADLDGKKQLMDKIKSLGGTTVKMYLRPAAQ